MSLPGLALNPTLRHVEIKNKLYVAEKIRGDKKEYRLHINGRCLGRAVQATSRHWDSFMPDGVQLKGEINCSRLRAFERLIEAHLNPKGIRQ